MNTNNCDELASDAKVPVAAAGKVCKIVKSKSSSNLLDLDQESDVINNFEGFQPTNRPNTNFDKEFSCAKDRNSIQTDKHILNNIRRKVCQDNSKSSNHSICISSPIELEKETHASCRKYKWQSEEEENSLDIGLNYIRPWPNCKSPKKNNKDLGLGLFNSSYSNMKDIFLSPKDGSLSRSSSEESFEGFFASDIKVSEYYIVKYKEQCVKSKDLNYQNLKVKCRPNLEKEPIAIRSRPMIPGQCGDNVSLRSKIGLSPNKENDHIGLAIEPKTEIKCSPNYTQNDEVNKAEFIGKYCQAVNCTISWLESGNVKELPVNINNGIVCELSEFAKKIAWESHYVIIWILRLRGIDTDIYDEQDLKSIISVIKRKKAILINFYGRKFYKAKLEAFATENFTFNSGSVIEKEPRPIVNKVTKSEKEMNSSRPRSISGNKNMNIQYRAKEVGLLKIETVILKDNRSPVEKCKVGTEIKEKSIIEKDLVGQEENNIVRHRPTSRKLSSISNNEYNLDLLSNQSLPVFSNRKIEDNILNKHSQNNVIISSSVKSSIKLQEKNQSLKKNVNLVREGKDIVTPCTNRRLSLRNLNSNDKSISKELDCIPVAKKSDVIRDYDIDNNILGKDLLNISKVNIPINSMIAPTNDNVIESNSENKEIDSSSTGTRPSTKKENVDRCTIAIPSNKSIKEQELHEKALDISNNYNNHEIYYENKLKVSPIMSKQELSGSYSDLGKSTRGRLRKPSVKLQELFNQKSLSSSPLLNESLIGISLDTQFEDDGYSIGKYCQNVNLTIKLLNSDRKLAGIVTNGIVYDLYHFFKKRNAKLTTLVHTIYRLKGFNFENSSIIAIMAKIHEMVKISWIDNIIKDPLLPFQEFNFEPLSREKKTENVDRIDQNDKEPSDQNITTTTTAKKRKYDRISPKNDDSSIIKKIKMSKSNTSNILFEANSPSFNNDIHTSPVAAICSNGVELNVTQGCNGKITRGDIFYFYTRWLKKKMEGHTKVFVTDLSSDVERLIDERNVGPLRIPVGTLMSTSVKIFEEFRRLSKINISDAKNYLLNDWTEDINSIKNPNISKMHLNEDNQGKVKLIKNNVTSIIDLSSKENDLIQESNNDNINCSVAVMPLLKPVIESKKIVKNMNEQTVLNRVCVNVNSTEVKEIDKNQGINIQSHNNEEYDVEKIVGYRIVKIGHQPITEYRIRWVGFYSQDDSWVNVLDLKCPEILAEFWKALNKQRALKNVNNPLQIVNTNVTKSKKVMDEREPYQNDLENNCPFFGIEAGGNNKFFKLFINNLKPALIDYHYLSNAEEDFPKRVKVSKLEVLQIYDNWRLQNQERLLAGGNSAVNIEILIAEVKNLMDSKKVRNFNPNCLINACYRMSLMKTKLKGNKTKLDEYLAGDFMKLAESSKKHQDFVRTENESKTKKYRNDKMNVLDSVNVIDSKVSDINVIEKEALNIAQLIKNNCLLNGSSFDNLLKKEILTMKNIELLAKNKYRVSQKNIKGLKEQNKKPLKEIKKFGISDEVLDHLLHLAMKKL